jgi:rhodanese-related sulfurtransferase
MKIGYKDLIEAAEKEIETLTPESAATFLDSSEAVFIDLRDIRELYRAGKIPGAVHAPRGMLEFWVDPESPYHKEIFAQDKTFIFYCQSGWRSALATQTVQKMGLTRACHIGGGYSAWLETGGPSEAVKPKT